MSTKHSRGDWSSDGPYIVCMPPNRKHDIYLAEIVDGDELGRFEKDSDKRSANAQLMAAAPRLLAALNAVAWHLDARLIAKPDVHAQESLDEAREAIEAATS